MSQAMHAGRLGLVIAALLTPGCRDVNVNTALAQLSQAHHLAGDLLTEFTRAADAANRAVMSESDAQSVLYAQEAQAAKAAVRKDIDALKPLLQDARYENETRLLEEFVKRFGEYEALDRRVLDLAVENTNLQAQRLSFGPAQAAADAFRDAMEAVALSVPAKDSWKVKAVVENAVAAVREIQALQAPHIADAEDASMAGLEQRMAAAETLARADLAGLQVLVGAAERARLAEASSALDTFMGLNAQIVALSRRNTNVRSLALSLDQKRKLIGPCEETLRALRDSLSKHGYPLGR